MDALAQPAPSRRPPLATTACRSRRRATRTSQGALILVATLNATVGCGGPPLIPTAALAPSATPITATSSAASPPPPKRANSAALVRPVRPAAKQTASSPTAAPAPSGPVPELAPAAPSSAVHSLEVPGDRQLEVVLGPPQSAIAFMYLHGVCGDVLAFRSWVQAASRLGTLIAMRGDTTCDARPLRQKWTYDMRRLDHRIARALAAVDALRGARTAVTALDPSSVVLIGYSQGAHIVQWMANYKPKRYRRLVMIALAKEPQALRLRGASHILLMAGGRDARSHIRAGHRKLLRAGLNSRYLELPGARHGQYGPQALAVMHEGLRWVVDAPQSVPNADDSAAPQAQSD